MTLLEELLSSTQGVVLILVFLLGGISFRYFAYRTEMRLIEVGHREEAKGGYRSLLTAGVLLLGVGIGDVIQTVAATQASIPEIHGITIGMLGLGALGSGWYYHNQDSESDGA